MSTIGQRIRDARKGAKLTQDAVAKHFGIKRVSVTQWESDTTSPGRDRLSGLAELMGGDVDWYLTGVGTPPGSSDGLLKMDFATRAAGIDFGSIKGDSPPEADSAYPRYPPNASPPVPVSFKNETIGMFGQAVGGEDGRFVLNGSRVMDVHCPPTLIGVKDAYGVFVHGSSMKPRYREGEAVFVNPHLPVRQDDYAIVQIKGEYEGDDIGGFIKQFISQNSKELVLAQHQRPETFPVEEASEGRYLLRFPRSKVAAVHRIVWAGEV